MPLSPEIKQLIADEADEYARTYSGTKLIKRPYIAGAEAWAERAAGLAEALEAWQTFDARIHTAIDAARFHLKAKKELDKYNSPSK